jgi:hypothetical protein
MIDRIKKLLSRLKDKYPITDIWSGEQGEFKLDGVEDTFYLHVSPDHCFLSTNSWHEHFRDQWGVPFGLDGPYSLEEFLDGLFTGNIQIMVKYRGKTPIGHQVAFVRNGRIEVIHQTAILLPLFWRKKWFKKLEYKAIIKRQVDNIKERAEYFRIGLMLGVHTVSEVVEWADSVIQRQDNPSYIFTELSLMDRAHPDSVILQLTEFPGTADKLQIVRKVLPRLLGPMYHNLSQHPELGQSLAKDLNAVYFQLLQELGLDMFQMPKDLYLMSIFDDLYYQAESGSDDAKMKALKEFLAFLKPYAEKLNGSPQ